MSTESVIYELSLKDMLSGAIEKADQKAQKLENTITGIGAGIAAVFTAREVFNFVGDSVTAFNEAAQASAQLDATLRSTGGAAGLVREALDAQSQSLMNNSLFDDDQITKAQSLLATFTNIKDKIYMDAIPAAVDLASKLGGDLNGAVMQVGKALQDPAQGLTALRRSGVSFSDAQIKVIKSLLDTGREAEVQSMILAELNKEFGGAAAAAAAAGTGPFTIVGHKFQNAKEKLGELVIKITSGLLPAMEAVVKVFETSLNWLESHKELLSAVAVGVGVLAAGLFVLEIPLIATTVAGWALSGAFYAISAAMAVTPLGWIVIALAAVSAGVVYLWKKSETFRATVLGVWEVLKSFFSFILSVGSGVADIISGIFNGDPTQAIKGVEKIKNAWKDLDIKKSFEIGQAKGVSSFMADEKEGEKTALTAKLKPPGGVNIPGSGAGISGGEKVVGNKSVSIIVNIQDLIREYNVTTNNINEAADKGRSLVAEALIAATNDFQLTAGV